MKKFKRKYMKMVICSNKRKALLSGKKPPPNNIKSYNIDLLFDRTFPSL